jgi:23S rRNA pseudouridine2604 synthase
MKTKKASTKKASILRKNDTEGRVRLSKRMSELGMCSRREADEWIPRGWVMVNGIIVDALGSKVGPNDKIELLPQALKNQEGKLSIILNKPVGYLSHKSEDDYQTATSLLRNENQFEDSPEGPALNKHNTLGLAPVGRLDIDSKGLILFTQDGRLAKQIIGEDSEVEKEYVVKVDNKIHASMIAKLTHGLSLDGKELKRAKVVPVNDYTLNMTLIEGKKRQIRRMCEEVGLKVTSLKRVRIGKIKLGNLPEGQWRYLRSNEYF